MIWLPSLWPSKRMSGVREPVLIGLRIAALPNADELLADATPEESKRLLAKVDAIIISLSLVALSKPRFGPKQGLIFHIVMGATDKIALGSTSVMGIIADLHLVGQDYSWANSIIFFGGESRWGFLAIKV